MMLHGGRRNGQRFLSPLTVKAMTMNQVPDALKKTRGLGWAVDPSRAPFDGPYYGHEGRTGVSVQVYPEMDLACVFLIHQADRESRHVRDVFLSMANAAIVE